MEDPRSLVSAFIAAASHAGLSVPADCLQVEVLRAPHQPPPRLPLAKQAIYWFSFGDRCLKAGKAGPQSAARYTSQHYNPRSCRSNLAKSILKHRAAVKSVVPEAIWAEIDGLDESTVGAWIKQNTSRCNLLVDLSFDSRALSFLETFIQARLRPLFEGKVE